jgi:hypothetical protein
VNIWKWNEGNARKDKNWFHSLITNTSDQMYQKNDAMIGKKLIGLLISAGKCWTDKSYIDG